MMNDSGIKAEPLGGGTVCFTKRPDSITTDSLILADFAGVTAQDTACDLGSGCGVIPLLWLRDSRVSGVYAVEIRQNAVELINLAKEHNRLSDDRLTVVCSDLRELKGKMPSGCFTLVTMNPPYKKCDAGKVSEDGDAAAMRFELYSDCEEICASAKRLLKPSGRFCVCCRPERLTDYICAMREAGLEPKKLRLVANTPDSPPSLFLLCAVKGASGGLKIMPPLYTSGEGANGFSDEMNEIYGEYGKERKR